MFLKEPLRLFNISTFLQTQILMLPVLLLFYKENGLSLGDYFLFQGIFSISALLFEIPAGYIGDIFPRRNVLIFSYLLFVLRLILWLFFKGYWIVLIGEILYSMSKAFYSGVADGYVYDYLKTQNKTHKMLSKYGKLNFSMSVGTALASLIGPVLYREYGFIVLIIIELILNSTAIGLLFSLPNVASTHKHIKGIKAKYKELFSIAKTTFQNKNICYYIWYSGILAGTTMVFVWSFQPVMEVCLISVELFGIVYGVNHGCRALAAFCLDKTLKFISLKNLGILTYVAFILSFLVSILVVQLHSPTIGMILLSLICVVIGCQLTFTLSHVSRLHTFVPSDIRSTVASVNNMISRSMAGLMLILFKVFSMFDVSLSYSFLIYLLIFSVAIIPLHKILKFN